MDAGFGFDLGFGFGFCIWVLPGDFDSLTFGNWVWGFDFGFEVGLGLYLLNLGFCLGGCILDLGL